MLVYFFGSVAEWLCSGLQIRVRRFDSVPSLKNLEEKGLREPCIVGVSDFPLKDRGRAGENFTELSIQKYCAIEALNQAGLKMSDVDGIAVAGMWGMPGPGLMQPNVLVEYLGIKFPKWIEGTNIGGSTFLLHINHAYQAIKSGQCDTL